MHALAVRKQSFKRRRAVKMRVYGDNLVEGIAQEARQHALTDWLAAPECKVLPHVGQVGSDQDQALYAIAPPRIDREQQFHQSGIRLIE